MEVVVDVGGFIDATPWSSAVEVLGVCNGPLPAERGRVFFFLRFFFFVLFSPSNFLVLLTICNVLRLASPRGTQ